MELRRALVSVADKTNLEILARTLQAVHVEVLATPGSAAFLRASNFPDVVELSAFPTTPALLGDKITTLHAAVHAGIVATDDPADQLTVGAIGGAPIGMVVVNLTPVARTARPSFDELVASIDLGGPALLSSAISAWDRVVVLSDPADYGKVLQELVKKSEISDETRRRLAIKASTILARHQATLANQLSCFNKEGVRRPTSTTLAVVVDRVAPFKKGGDNPQQSAAMYAFPQPPPGTIPDAVLFAKGEAEVPTFHQALDATLAFDLLAEFDEPTCSIVARQRPVSTASASSLEGAFALALRGCGGAPLSSAIVGFNGDVSAALAAEVAKTAATAIATKSFDPQGIELLTTQRPDLCLIATRELLSPSHEELNLRTTPSTILAEERDVTCRGEVERGAVLSARQPLETETRALSFAWKVAKYCRSDACVVARVDADGSVRTLGVGASAVSRREAIDLALAQAGPATAGAVLASDGAITDAADLDLIMRRGIVAVAHPGSPNDAAIITAGSNVLAMVSTGVSHLRY